MNLITDQKPVSTFRNMLPFIIYVAIIVIGIIGVATHKDNPYSSYSDEPIRGDFRGIEY